jgi:hypothetical protein
MKTYKKILGIVSALIVASLTVLLVVDFIDEYYNWLEFFGLLVPIYIVGHYLIATKFGFEIGDNTKKSFFVVSSSVSIVLFILIPLTLFYLQNKEDKQEQARLEILKQPKVFANDTALYGIIYEFKTRYENENIDYVFRAIYPKSTKVPDITEYVIDLQDSSGFQVDKISINEWANLWDDKQDGRLGVSKAGKHSLPEKDKYERIHSFSVGIKSSR